MDHIDKIAAFVAVADLGGFAAASRKLSLSAPTVTRAIALLEDHLGVALFVRTTRFVRLTDVGERYLLDCRRILQDLNESEVRAAGAHEVPAGTLVIAAPIQFGQRFLVPLLVDFLACYPGVNARALLVDRTVHLIEEGVDIAIRMGDLPDSTMVAVALGHVRRVVCASPAYLEAHGRPQRPEHVSEHRVVASSADNHNDRWSFLDAGARVEIGISPRLVVSTNEAAIIAASHNAGLTQVMSYQVAEHLRAGTLERVLQPFEAEPIPVWLLSQEGRRAAAKQRVFVAFARERLCENAGALD